MKRIIFFISLILLSGLAILFTYNQNINSTNLYLQNKFLMSDDFQYICLYKGELEKEEEYYLLTRNYKFINDGNVIKGDIIMPKNKSIDSKIFGIDNVDLKENEIIISASIAKYYNLHINDIVPGNVYLLEDNRNYIVKDIIKNVFTVNNNIVSSNEGIIICGYNEIVNKLFDNESIGFLKQEEISNQGIILNDLFYKYDFIEENNNTIFINNLFVLILYLIFSSGLYFVYKLLNKFRIKDNIKYGSTSLNLFFKFYFIPLLNIFILLVMYLGCLILENYLSYGLIIFMPINLIIFLILMIFIAVTIIDIKITIRRS